MSPDLTLRQWDEREFASSRDSWQQLLQSTDADPLFMSWDWQWLWWRHHAPYLQARLHLLGIYDGQDRLVGLAPFYSHNAKVRGPIRVTRLEVNGVAWRHPDCVFSEYIDLIVVPAHAEAALRLISGWLAEHAFWHDMVMPYTRADSLLSRLAELVEGMGQARQTDRLVSYCVDVSGGFGGYVAGLSGTARRKVLHQRRKLTGLKLQQASLAEVDGYLESLWRLRGRRWGEGEGACARAFHRDLARHMEKLGMLRLTRLTSPSQFESYLYNIRVGNTEYYLQSAFELHPDQGLSPGYLHLGYAMEAAADAGLEKFDLLAGPGRNREYKRDFAASAIPLVCHQIFRARWLRALLRLQRIWSAGSESSR